MFTLIIILIIESGSKCYPTDNLFFHINIYDQCGRANIAKSFLMLTTYGIA